MESSIVDFRWDLCIPTIHKLAFQLPHVNIIGTHHRGNTRQESFNSCSVFQDMLYHCDYAEHVIAIFAHQIQY